MRRLLAAFLVSALCALPGHAWLPTIVAGTTTTAAATTPTIRSVGASAAGVSAQTCPTPAGAASGDLLIMFLKTEDQVIDTNDAAWTESASSPNTNATTRTTVFWLISDGTDDYLTTDSGTQNVCVVVAITAGTFNAVTPFNVTGLDDDASGTAVAIGAITTTVNNVLVLSGSSRTNPDASGSTEFSLSANASLTDVTERFDGTFLASNGGSLYIVSGVLATAGSTGSTTATAASTAVGANISLGIAPP